MSLKDQQLDGAEVLSAGAFKLDRARAIEKMARFQLEDPHRYVLELVAAAVCAGATEVHVLNNAADFDVAWDGRHPSADELEHLFDHVFSRSRDPGARMLQHLAQGIHGALGLKPRWVRLERPGAVLDFTDPMNVTRAAIERLEDTRVHVKERVSWPVIREWLGSPVREQALLRELARTGDVVLRVNDQVVDERAEPPQGAEVSDAPDTLWLQAGRSPGVAWVRDGVIVDRRPLVLGPLTLAGRADADAVELNASRSQVLEDEHASATHARVAQAAAALILQEMQGARLNGKSLRAAALHALTLDIEPRELADEQLFYDAIGRGYTLNDLLGHDRIYTFTRRGMGVASLSAPQFLEQTQDPDGRDPLRLQWAVLTKRIPGRTLQNGDTLLTNLRFGEARRAELRAKGVPLQHTGPRVHQNTFEVRTKQGTVIGSAAFGIQTQGHPGRAVAHIRVEGLPLEQRVLELPGPSSVRIECKGLTADQRFERVNRDVVYKQVVRVAQAQARQLLLDVAVHHPGHPAVRDALLEWMSDLRPPKKWSAKGVRAVVPPQLLDAALFKTLDGQPCALRDLVHWADDHGQVEYAPPMTLSFEAPPRVVALRNDQAKLLRPLLPRRLRSIERALTDREQREQRRNALPIRPVLTEYTVAHGPIQTTDFHGEVGFTNRSGPATLVRVLKQGVELGQVEVRVGYPGSIACVEWPTVEANGAWTELAHESSARVALKPRLTEALTELLPKALDTVRPDIVTLPAWLVAMVQEQRTPPHAVDQLSLFKTLGGARRTLGELGALTKGGTKRLRYVREAPAVCPPGLEHLVLLDPSRSKVYSARWSRQLQDESKRLERLHQARRAFLTRPVQIDRDAPVAWTSVLERLGDAINVRVGLSLDPDHTSGLKIHIHHESRLLTTVLQTSATPYAAVVWGPGVRPSADYTSLESGSLETLSRRVRSVVREHQRSLLTDDLPNDPATQIRLLIGLTGQTGLKLWEQDARDRLAKEPLFPTAGGPPVAYEALQRAATTRSLVWVPPELSDRRPPDDRLWLVLSPELQRGLRKRFAGMRDGRAELQRRAKGQQRRTKLPKVGISAPGAFLATWTVSGPEGRAFLGCLPAGQRGRIEWLVEDRIIESEPFTAPLALHARVAHTGLQADDAFEHAHPGKAKKAARGWVLEQVPLFMLAAAQVIASGRAKAPVALGAVQRGAMLPLIVRWAASRSLPPGWSDVKCVPTTDGAGVSLPELKRLGSRGRIRIVSEQLQGRALDGVLVVQADRDLQTALQAYGKLHAYDDVLKQTLRSATRRNAPPVELAPLEHAGVLQTLPVQGPGRRGWLHVLRGGTTRVELTIGGVPLCGFSHAGPVPLFGTISDTNLSADPMWTRPVRDDALTQLEAHLQALSEQALVALLDNPPDALDLWLRVIRRALPDAKDRRSGKRHPKLAALPLFPTGDGRMLSTQEIARMGQPRWVSPELAVPSADPERPFVVIPGRLFALAIEVFGGEVAERQAQAARDLHKRLSRDRLPFELQKTVLVSTRIERGDWRLLVGLVPDLDAEPGHVLVRCEGIPITNRPVPFPGMTGTLELPRSQVDALFKVATLNVDQDRALNDAYAELVAAQVPTLREGFFSRLRVTKVLSGMARHGGAWKAWAAAELFDGLAGSVTLGHVVAAETVVFGDPGDTPVPDDTVALARSTANAALLSAAGIVWVPVAKWLDQQTLAQRESQREARQRNRTRRMTRLRSQVDSHLVTLAQGLAVAERAMTEARAVDREEGELLERALDGDPAASWALAWRRLDRELRALDQWDHAAEVAIRAGEALASLDESQD